MVCNAVEFETLPPSGLFSDGRNHYFLRMGSEARFRDEWCAVPWVGASSGVGVSSASVAGCDDVLYPQCRLIHPRGRRFREVGAIRVLAA